MTIEFRKEWYYAGLWFADLPIMNADFMGCLYKKGEKEDWILDYRIRYHVDDKVFDSEDRKSWYRMGRKGTEPEKRVVLETSKIIRKIAKTGGGKMQFARISGDGDRAMLVLVQQGYAHMKQVDKDSPEGKEILNAIQSEVHPGGTQTSS